MKVSFGSTTASVCSAPSGDDKNKKLKGIVHNRASELCAHKDIIQIASTQMVEAISKKDYE